MQLDNIFKNVYLNFDESERGEWSWLKAQLQKTKIMASGPITSWEIHGETVATMADFILGAPKSL